MTVNRATLRHLNDSHWFPPGPMRKYYAYIADTNIAIIAEYFAWPWKIW